MTIGEAGPLTEALSAVQGITVMDHGHATVSVSGDLVMIHALRAAFRDPAIRPLLDADLAEARQLSLRLGRTWIHAHGSSDEEAITLICE